MGQIDLTRLKQCMCRAEKGHRIEIEILDDHMEDAAPFYLMPLILA